jgi:uncharacterized membrane protein (DUF441 family)
LEPNIIILTILVISVLGKADSVSIAASMLLIIRLLHFDQFVFPVVAKNGVFWAIVLLISAILIPIASGSITSINIKNNLTSWVGIAALIISFGTTYLSGVGLTYLTVPGNSEVMPALIIGAIAATAFLGGVPVGPLITSGILAMVMKLFHKS